MTQSSWSQGSKSLDSATYVGTRSTPKDLKRRGSMATQLAPGLARKVKKVLETRADTPETIACLKGLSEFYGENTPAARRGATSSHDSVLPAKP